GTTNITMSIAGVHGLNPGDQVFINFPSGSLDPDTIYQVLTVPDATHFTIGSIVATNSTDNGATVLPLVAPSLTRSGNVTIQWSTWNLGFTDSGSSSSLLQTPLNSPTVFNFFFPDYKFPGILASAALTT